METKHPFLPIIIGTDMNAYNMAISFHEAYGIKPILVGKEHLSFTSLSSITETIEIRSGLADDSQFANILIEVARKYRAPGKTLLLIGTNDLYVRLIIENAKILREHYVFNYINEELMNQLQVKANFYELCKVHGIDTPTTFFYSCNSNKPFEEEMMFPVIIKPSNGIEYSRNKFEGQQKVYKVESPKEMHNVIQQIKTGGYRDELIIQDYIPGDDTFMWDSVIYANSKGKTQLVTFAQVVLQEHTVTAIGNYTALITRFDKDVMVKLQNFLEAVGYNGFANFDLKYDSRDNTFKVFEVNIRQGRSSYYVTALGHNMAEYFVDDLIYHTEKSITYLNEDFLFTVVPKAVLRNFVANKAVLKDIKRLIKKGQYGNPLFYKQDKHLKRKIYLLARQVNYYKKYKNNQW
ncbi:MULTISPECIES: carboxylate--amine ligase [Planococcus]|uniref:Carboxylate--amine ligase n=1 Tax=Planococcus faecalis TaxID=1598147 RepID=A0ABM6IQW4_9BACL|nr:MULTISPECIES: carboxylate--amine ligase [Planococcus]AQU78980.1 carboxylate--amine ligase [Planococcus faecalis]MDJ0330920.1 carboxylate--amine ligase [Planococcus sp. S3-L1]OHX54719.1 carboxylate--amine ligase [Planococcus faecalis]